MSYWSPLGPRMSYVASFDITGLEKSHDRKAFCSGCPPLDDFLRRYARQALNKGESTTVVAAAHSSILGYATWVTSELEVPNNRRVPVLRLGRMAVAQQSQGCGVGKYLVAECVKTAKEIRKLAGCTGVLVDAKRCSQANVFYSRLGFGVLRDEPGEETVQMFLSLRNA